MNYNNKRFRPVSNSDNGEVSEDMIFHYQQSGQILTCTYSGKNIISGHLIGLVSEDGKIDMRYHQVNKDHQMMTGICESTPEVLSNGKIKLHEQWLWTSGDRSKGTSLLEEV